MCGSAIRGPSFGNDLLDMGNPFSKRTTTDFTNMTKWVGNKRDVDSPDTSTDDAATARLRAETDRIYADLQKKRDMTSADKITAGEFDAQNALQALSSAFTRASGDEWQPQAGTLNRARRSTLLAGSSRSQLTRASSASIVHGTSGVTNQLAATSTGTKTRLPTYSNKNTMER